MYLLLGSHSLQDTSSRGKRELANSVDDNELQDFTDVFTLKWNIMMALKRFFTIAVICIPFSAMFTLSKLECFWAHHSPVLMFLSTSVENQYLGSFCQFNHLWWVCTVFQNVQRGFFFSIRDLKILLYGYSTWISKGRNKSKWCVNIQMDFHSHTYLNSIILVDL